MMRNPVFLAPTDDAGTGKPKSYSLNAAMIDDAQAGQAQHYADHFGQPGYDDPTCMYISQRYDGYTDENQETWTTLFDRQMQYLADNASNVWLSGAKAINLRRDHIPDLSEINSRLGPLTGWASRAVPGYVPAQGFFACIGRREFPTTIVIRPKDSIDYLPEPDIFHDIFGHVPLHADPVFADFLQTYGQAALTTNDESHTERLARLFWFTVEFGLIREDGRLKIYGSGLISSPGESRHALESPEVDRRPFDLDRVCDTAFEIDHYQPILYVLESFEQLRDAMNTYAQRLLKMADETPLSNTSS
ncbi:MAG: phenylalanine 4-monooxygenase [Planctomycetes bacterium]|nr:phenylalanine 4-monooxygenase [Planctomycetota bacterium]NOG54801.1 phenylalanine 4-monooxygenase [Planctomycetota bacterium]